jgi:hypothetical protein
MPEYTLAARTDADRLAAEAEALSARGRVNVQRATNYVLGVVLFAAALFFAGISTKLQAVRLRRVLLGLGVAVFLATAVWLATFPVSFDI